VRWSALLLACGCHASSVPAASSLGSAVVRRGDVVDRVLLTGSLHPSAAVELGLPIAWQTPIRWMIGDGAKVKAGDRVLEFDDADQLAAQAELRVQLRAAESDLQGTTEINVKAIADKRGAIRGAEIERDKAKLQAGLPGDLMPLRKAQENQLTLHQAEANLAELQRGLATLIATNALDQRIVQIRLDQTRRGIATATAAIDALAVKAPRDGVALVDSDPWQGHKYRVGDKISPDQPVISMPDLTKPIQVRADLIDVDDGRIELHLPATCTLDAYPVDPIPCTVEELTPVASPKPGQDSLRRTFSVMLALEHRDPAHLRPGMSVKVELHRLLRDALVVPRAAVMRGSGDRVWLASGELRAVTIAACDAQQCAVSTGLAEGDVLALGGRQ